MSIPQKGYKEIKEDCPPIPENTCPHIDKAQKYLEGLRDQNEALRDIGKYWSCALGVENLNKPQRSGQSPTCGRLLRECYSYSP